MKQKKHTKSVADVLGVTFVQFSVWRRGVNSQPGGRALFGRTFGVEGNYRFDRCSVVSFVIKKLVMDLFKKKQRICLVIEMYFMQIYFDVFFDLVINLQSGCIFEFLVNYTQNLN